MEFNNTKSWEHRFFQLSSSHQDHAGALYQLPLHSWMQIQTPHLVPESHFIALNVCPVCFFFSPLWGKQSYEADISPIFLSHFLTFFRFAQSKIKYHVTTGNLGKICLIQHAVKIYSTLHWSWEISLTRSRKWAPCSLLVLISLHPPHKRRWQDQQVPPGKIDCLGIRQLTLRLVACFPQNLGHVIHFSYSKLLYYNLHRQYQGSPVESCWVLSSVILL